jgi:hypothetical protein
MPYFRSLGTILVRKLALLNLRKYNLYHLITFRVMFKHFVGVELLEEETALIESWLTQNYASSQLSLENLRRLFMTEFRH